MHVDMHMNLYTGFFFLFYEFMNMCELKCRYGEEQSLFSQQGIRCFFLQIKDRIPTWSIYDKSVLMANIWGLFYFKQLNKTRRMLL